MPINELYRRQVALLIKMLPHVAEEDCFALKGGTAINLFVRDMPRLSVDVDLTYLPMSPRAESLSAIDAALKRTAQRIRKSFRGAQIAFTETKPENAIVSILIRNDGVQVKIEVTPVMRGCVYDPEFRTVSPAVEEAFGFAEMRVVSFPDLYAGKIVAALDRQHPRDLFDVRDLLANEGIDNSLRRAFIVYLISHNRPMAETLNPARKSLANEFLRGFDGMTARPVLLEHLTDTRETLIESIVGQMPDPHRRFLISFERGEPDWPLLEVPGASGLPAVRWRQRNLDTLVAEGRAKLVSKLESVFPGYETLAHSSEPSPARG